MSRQTEKKRLINNLSVQSGGYVTELCPVCYWWRLIEGNRTAFETDYSSNIRCNCPGKVKPVQKERM